MLLLPYSLNISWHLGVEGRQEPPVHGEDIAGVPHWVARQLSDVAEVEVRVVAGQLTQPAHQLVRLV